MVEDWEAEVMLMPQHERFETGAEAEAEANKKIKITVTITITIR